MKDQDHDNERKHQRPRNKATMDEPQEEFIEAENSHAPHDREHGDELRNTSHASVWQDDAHAA